jgi:hypothetical protein
MAVKGTFCPNTLFKLTTSWQYRVSLIVIHGQNAPYFYVRRQATSQPCHTSPPPSNPSWPPTPRDAFGRYMISLSHKSAAPFTLDVRHLVMTHLMAFLLLLSVSLIAGCGGLQRIKIYAPETFGLSQVTPNLYIEADADEATRLKIREIMGKAENNINAAYGSVKSNPVILACVSESCYESFGEKGTKANSYGGGHILLSPRGLNWYLLTHEWSHAELYSRLNFMALWHLPTWFDEGLAVMISEAPEHSELHWNNLLASNTPRPTRKELYTFKSLSQWYDAVHKYGDDKNMERKAKGEPESYPVYATAGHELRSWLADAGSQGLLALIVRLNNGEEVESIYHVTDKAVR